MLPGARATMLLAFCTLELGSIALGTHCEVYGNRHNMNKFIDCQVLCK